MNVDDFMETLDHPHKPEIEALRRAILAVDPKISEAVKWNAPSFKTTDFFATVHLRAKDCVQVVLHTGAKKKAGGKIEIDDPEGLLKMLAKDRGMATLKVGKTWKAQLAAFKKVVKQWLAVTGQ